jgi:hypothetical protein
MREVTFLAVIGSLVCNTRAAGVFSIQSQGLCLTALSPPEAVPVQFIFTKPCNTTDYRQKWTFDDMAGTLCSSAVGSPCLRQLTSGSPEAEVVLASSGGPVSPDCGYPEIKLDYNPTSQSLYVRGNCSLPLDSNRVGPEPHDLDWPVYLYGAAGGQQGDCNNPSDPQKWKFVSELNELGSE